MTNAAYRKLTLGLIAAWFLFAVVASALHTFQNDPARSALSVMLAAGGPVVLFLAWFASSPGFRRFAASLNSRALTLAQTWRVIGFSFVVLSALGMLPAVFAIPAGLGDTAVGMTAPLVARRLANREHRGGFLVWQFLGIADLVLAIGLGVTAGILNPQAGTMDVMATLPLSLVPTFFVPLLVMIHVISISQALRWPRQEDAHSVSRGPWRATSKPAVS